MGTFKFGTLHIEDRDLAAMLADICAAKSVNPALLIAADRCDELDLCQFIWLAEWLRWMHNGDFWPYQSLSSDGKEVGSFAWLWSDLDDVPVEYTLPHVVFVKLDSADSNFCPYDGATELKEALVECYEAFYELRWANWSPELNDEQQSECANCSMWGPPGIGCPHCT